MPAQPKKRFPLPKRFNVALSEKAYRQLRDLSAKYGFGNNYLLTFLLENLGDVVDEQEFDRVFRRMSDEYGSPKSGR
jgi:hypothetical protein